MATDALRRAPCLPLSRTPSICLGPIASLAIHIMQCSPNRTLTSFLCAAGRVQTGWRSRVRAWSRRDGAVGRAPVRESRLSPRQEINSQGLNFCTEIYTLRNATPIVSSVPGGGVPSAPDTTETKSADQGDGSRLYHARKLSRGDPSLTPHHRSVTLGHTRFIKGPYRQTHVSARVNLH